MVVTLCTGGGVACAGAYTGYTYCNLHCVVHGKGSGGTGGQSFLAELAHTLYGCAFCNLHCVVVVVVVALVVLFLVEVHIVFHIVVAVAVVVIYVHYIGLSHSVYLLS